MLSFHFNYTRVSGFFARFTTDKLTHQNETPPSRCGHFSYSCFNMLQHHQVVDHNSWSTCSDPGLKAMRTTCLRHGIRLLKLVAFERTQKKKTWLRAASRALSARTSRPGLEDEKMWLDLNASWRWRLGVFRQQPSSLTRCGPASKGTRCALVFLQEARFE